VYWLSTVNDVVANFSGSSPTTTTYGDLTDLQTLPKTTISATAATHAQAGPDGDDTATDVTLTNTSNTLAFMVRVDVRRAGDSGDNQVAPVEWSDNYITLWPGESQTVTAQYASSLLQGKSAVVSVEGWNVDATTAATSTATPHAADAFGVADGAVPAATARPGKEATPAVLRREAKRIVTATAKLRGTRATVRITCASTPCTGTVVLKGTARRGHPLTLKRLRFKAKERHVTLHTRLKRALVARLVHRTLNAQVTR
jgi:exo-1,4-beta-D-glucosaminidase